MSEEDFDAKKLVEEIERQEVGGQLVTWENAGPIADRILSRVEQANQALPSTERVALREALERRSAKFTIDIADGEPMINDTLAAKLFERVEHLLYYKPQLSERDKEVVRLREIGESLHGKSVKMAFAVQEQTYTGPIIGMTEKHVIQEALGAPALVIHDRQLIRGQGFEVGQTMQVHYSGDQDEGGRII